MALIVGGIVVAVLLVGVGMYNSLVGKKNQVENAFATIDVMLKKRYDLIPNLVACVKQYAKHESAVLQEVTELRARALSGAVTSDEAVSINNRIGKALGGLMAVVENYPELKANEQFLQLQRTLNEIEEQLSAARRAFNASITLYNNAVEMFPTSLVAGMMGYQRRQWFEAPEAERAAPNVGEALSSQ